MIVMIITASGERTVFTLVNHVGHPRSSGPRTASHTGRMATSG